MPISFPRLDDRNFESILKSAMERLRQITPEWNGTTLSDPGVVLLELFSYLTEEVIYRINKLPEKTYVEFLNLLGGMPSPPSVASVNVTFTVKQECKDAIEIPAFTKVTTASGAAGSPVFLTVKKTILSPAQNNTVTVRAVHATYFENEDYGSGTGEPGFFITVRNKPIVTDPLGELATIVAVESADTAQKGTSMLINSRYYQQWEECFSRIELNWTKKTFLVEKTFGIIRFPLKLYSSSPEMAGVSRDGLAHRDKNILVSYFGAGEGSGNVAANTLTRITDPVLSLKLTVTNSAPATGGRAQETLEEFIQRAPELIHSTERLVTAQDFNIEVLKNRAIAQVSTHAKSEIWEFAEKGTVYVSLVPSIELKPWENPESVATADTVHTCYREARKPELLAYMHERIKQKSVLGISVECAWADIQPIVVNAAVVTWPLQSSAKVNQEIQKALHQYFAILPSPAATHNESRYTSINIAELYTLIMGIGGVRHVRKMSLQLVHTPDKKVTSIEKCGFMAGYYLATAHDGVYFTINHGDDWHLLLECPADEEIDKAAINQEKPGHIALLSHLRNPDTAPGGASTTIRTSGDNGKTWQTQQLAFPVYDCCWINFGVKTVVVIAAGTGLYRIDPEKKVPPHRIPVTDYRGGFYKIIAANATALGKICVAASACDNNGVYIAFPATGDWTFLPAVYKGNDIRALVFESADSRLFLWAGVTTTGNNDGEGCFRCEITAAPSVQKSVVHFKNGWVGGSCRCLHAINGTIYAGTHRRGILFLETEKPAPRWETLPLECGLPLRDITRIFVPVNCIISMDKGLTPADQTLMTGTEAGIYQGSSTVTFKELSSKTRYYNVTIPKSWFFCSGKHEITMEEYHEGRIN